MLNNDPIQNSILHRAKSKTNRAPFLIPLNDSTSSISNYFTNSKDKSTASRKSVRVTRPDTIKRAINDACMAAAIGDLEWLKQTFKVSNEKAFDKDGFSTIHLASIHGRMNIIKYLIEEQNFDPNYPSEIHYWYPVHLCISNQIGSRSVDCLKYLILKGADINVKNNDDVYPLHMAASEGQVDCLKILLELKPNANVVDKRGQTPLDLAKLWGHKSCAKILSAYMWSQEKRDHEIEKKNQNRIRTQDILKEIEKAHFEFYPDKEESEKNFEKWLINQGFDSKGNIKESPSPPKVKKEYNLGLTNLLLIPDSEYKKDSARTYSQLDLDSQDATSNFASSRKTLSKRKENKLQNKILHHSKEWNYSTKSQIKEYVSNLKDFFPRDPYSLMPSNIDLVLLSKELRGMSLEQVKEFMKKNLRHNKSTPNLKPERPVHFKPKNIIDTQSKVRSEEQKLGIDKTGLILGDDLNSFGFRQAINFIRSNYTFSDDMDYDNNENQFVTDINLIMPKKYIDDKLEIVKKHYGEELADFMMNRRNGKMSQKYEKVFIS